ncbi:MULTISPECIES: cation diffusion facilitator family transporter [unclassified Oceanobacter]|jgi:ferrous-iron efflux pump FieF|uniref:cation diffusion facilitator family transporter n=2 Tax=Gammaproteobacteria TaxID=1236 RepID=UPI0026E40F63|nr:MULTISPECIES: cation diffusion facilitator family transporter [unclassified Oceanobacter]MDO6682495.1 cation diffusion facilitator family transporter [Oceanobacter sp. 5_MG-2023]MDP2506450.1 cation diffusion facilitator family transporter [Oceanobacter sp. 3_MG-2023]MDP2549001.1 cation diffusion facilitator family transporter [Oceanobacter sp. 4_MG-2023]MDP2609175.1 cation diffusion facilitator family transporter [Oceanobacter sp. 1_MG-2023]MDP2612533.1 cation diffusion facilitator family t
MSLQPDAILIRRAAMASIATAVILLVAKLGAWSVSDSTSVLSSLLDSLMDIAASVVNFFAIRYALMPADDEHPFGHSKAEGLAALVQSAFILGSVVALLLHVTDRLLDPQPLKALGESIGVMLFSTALTTALVLYQRWVVRKTGSLAVKADSAHYYGDILTSLAVVVALLGAWFGQYWLDPVIALVIALVLVRSVYEIIQEALVVLMDQAMPEAEETELHQLIKGVDGVRGFHDMKTRQAGAVQFIQFHLDMDGDQTLNRAHAIGDQVEAAILARFPRAEVLIHHDPV